MWLKLLSEGFKADKNMSKMNIIHMKNFPPTSPLMLKKKPYECVNGWNVNSNSNNVNIYKMNNIVIASLCNNVSSISGI